MKIFEKKADGFVIRYLLIPGVLLFLVNHFWFKFTLLHPFPRLILVIAGVCGLVLTAYEALTTGVTCNVRYPISSVSAKDLYRLRNITPGDILTNVVFGILFAYIFTVCLNGLTPIRTISRDTIVREIGTHVSRTRGGGSTERYTLDVDSWERKGELLTLEIDRPTGLKLNVGAPIHVETKIGLLGLEFFRNRHQTFRFRKGYRPPFAQPD